MNSTPFSASWENLTLEDLREFFATAGDEGLTWEAKGGTIKSDDVVEAASAFGNGLLGGFLVLGASRANKKASWLIDGWDFPTEPNTWVSSCLMNDGVKPRPYFDTRSWSLDERRSVAVVNFRPVPVPPVITRQGQVWERLSGLSQQVRDPASMRELVHRGEEAMSEATQVSEAGRDDMWNASPFGHRCAIVLSMAAPGFLGDVSALLFRESTTEEAEQLFSGPLVLPFVGSVRPAGGVRDISQHALTLWTGGVDSEGICIRLGRHGSVAVGRAYALPESGLRQVAASPSDLAPFWTAAARMMEHFVRESPVHVALRLSDPEKGGTDIGRWSNLPGPSDDDLAAVAREARRALGRAEWEPE